MRKSPLVSILFLTVAGCGDDPVAPEPSVRATLIFDFEEWDQEGQERRGVKVAIVRQVSDIRYFRDLPQDGVVEISTTLPCVGDLLHDPILVNAVGVTVSGSTRLDGFACTEEPQVVSDWKVFHAPGNICINPDNWLGDC